MRSSALSICGLTWLVYLLPPVHSNNSPSSNGAGVWSGELYFSEKCRRAGEAGSLCSSDPLPAWGRGTQKVDVEKEEQGWGPRVISQAGGGRQSTQHWEVALEEEPEAEYLRDTLRRWPGPLISTWGGESGTQKWADTEGSVERGWRFAGGRSDGECERKPLNVSSDWDRHEYEVHTSAKSWWWPVLTNAT